LGSKECKKKKYAFFSNKENPPLSVLMMYLTVVAQMLVQETNLNSWNEDHHILPVDSHISVREWQLMINIQHIK
jgi:hypothetical protein